MSTQEQMFALVDKHRQGGLSAKDFCERNNIGLSRFNYWARKKRQLDSDSGFIKITREQHSTHVPIELIYPNGVRLQLTAPDPALIGSLLKIY